MARVGRILAWLVAILVAAPALVVAVVLVGGNTGPGRHLIGILVPRVTAGAVKITGLAGRFPDRLRAATVRLEDPHGTYLTVRGVRLDWLPLRLAHGLVEIDRLDAASADLARMPESSGATSSSGFPVKVAVRQFQVDRLTIGAPVAGKTIVVAVRGAGRLDSESAGSVRLTARQPSGGRYSLAGSISSRNLRMTFQGREPAHGLVADLAGLPDLGRVAIDAALNGPRDAVATGAHGERRPAARDRRRHNKP